MGAYQSLAYIHPSSSHFKQIPEPQPAKPFDFSCFISPPFIAAYISS